MSTYDINDPAPHPPVGAWMWHVHHEALCEPLTEPLQARIDCITSKKPEGERATRLRVLTPVLGPVPAALDKAGRAYDEARDGYYKARDAYDKARRALDKARVAFGKARRALDKAWVAYVKALDLAQPVLEALHAVEHPDCPWNGQTIFP